jgi:hypothetical protein
MISDRDLQLFKLLNTIVEGVMEHEPGALQYEMFA